MPTRNKAEKKKIEKRIKLERIIVPAVFVLGIAAFIIVSTVIGRNAEPIEPKASVSTPEPDPCKTAIDALADKLGGETAYGDTFASLSYKSGADGSMPVVTAYLKSGVLCLRMTREIDLAETDPEETPQATEDLFGESSADETPSAQECAEDDTIPAVAREICDCLACFYGSGDMTATIKKTEDILRSFADGSAKKGNAVFGVYLVELKYSDSDGILTVVCEPA